MNVQTALEFIQGKSSALRFRCTVRTCEATLITPEIISNFIEKVGVFELGKSVVILNSMKVHSVF